MLADELQLHGEPVPERLVFEKAAGLVRIELAREGDIIVGAELTVPRQPDRRLRQ